jgi:hypothetical protein
MAISGHWIEAKVVRTPSGPQYALKLRADLIGFITTQSPGKVRRAPKEFRGDSSAWNSLAITQQRQIQNRA